MKIDEFVDQTLLELKEFRKWYYNNSYHDPKNFSLDLDEGEWFEQYLTWLC